MLEWLLRHRQMSGCIAASATHKHKGNSYQVNNNMSSMHTMIKVSYSHGVSYHLGGEDLLERVLVLELGIWVVHAGMGELQG